MSNQLKIPLLRFNDFNDIWKETTLGKLGAFLGGGTPGSTKKEHWQGNIPWISSSDISENNIHEISKTRYITEDAIKESATKIIPKNAILIVSRVGIGKFAVANEDLCTSQDFTNLITNQNSYFLAYYFLARVNEFKKLSQGTSIKGFTVKDIKDAKFALPLLEEQQKIASFLTAIDEKITLLQKKKQGLEQYKKGVMQQLFSQKLRFEKEDGSDYPDWEEKKLNNVFFEHKEKNVENITEEVFSVAKHKGVINQIEHLGRSYSAATIEHYKIVNPNDVIYTKSPTSNFPFGIIKQNLTERTGVVSPLYVVLKPYNKSIGFILHNYFSSWINTYNYLNPLVQKGAKNTMNINNDDFLNGATISLPVDENEQKNIADFLRTIENKINLVSIQLDNTQQYKRGLLQKMFV